MEQQWSAAPVVKGAACLSCKGICSGFLPHSWRKACTQCGCSVEDHGPSSDLEDDHKMGRLLADSKYVHLTAKVKGVRVYKRNRMVITNPVVSRKDPTFNTITYDWAPPGLTQKLLMRQLPVYDQDPSQCHRPLSEDELQAMSVFMKTYKEEALGVGEVALPGEGGAHPPPTVHCSGCGELAPLDSPVVYAEWAGYDKQWHATCFVCSECGEALVDLVYYWREGELLCGRHYCQRTRPRCSGCDELIFCEDYKKGADGRAWHHDHYCCWRCGQSLDSPCSCPLNTQPQAC
ncbi:unnamed protein product [Coregonus sp. 'balchen']|nr:unnamed protein product [Coregonus sp. 'balchen']